MKKQRRIYLCLTTFIQAFVRNTYVWVDVNFFNNYKNQPSRQL